MIHPNRELPAPAVLPIVLGALCILAAVAQPLGAQGATQAIPPIIPSQFNGDVRNLPQAPTAPGGKLPVGKIPSVKTTTPHGPQASAPNFPKAPAPNPLLSFDGLSFNTAVTGGQAGAGHPPDPNGDTGRKHFIEAVNDAYAIYDKNGLLLSAFTENSLWAGAGTPCDGNSFGDPVALYDVLADRWILTHFAFAVDARGNPLQPFYQCFAVSKTNDPVAGGYFRYPVRIDTGVGGLPPAGSLNDYPKFGIWTDCLYMSANLFLAPAFNFSGTLYGSLSKSDMYAGLPLTASFGTFGTAPTDPFTLIPTHLNGTSSGALPPAGTPNYFVSESQTLFDYEVRKFTAGPNCGAGGTLSAASLVSQSAYTFPAIAGNTDIVPQPGTAQKLDTVDDRLMQRVQYRKVGGSESLWVVHNVNTAPVGEQWAQLNVTGGVIAPAPVQQQIYSPDALFRWMGSIAADNQGNAALGYSTSGPTAPNFPSIAYSGRLVGDALNSLPQTEVQMVAGTGSQTTIDRWGDYSSMTIDPSDDCTFWYNTEYYVANGSNWHTRIGAFKFPTCVAKAPTLAFTKTHVGNFTQGQIGATYTITVSNTGTALAPGPFTVTDTVPAGLTPTAAAGAGWTCNIVAQTVTCTRTNALDFLLDGTSFPAITLTVNVAVGAPASVTNTAMLTSSSGSPTVQDPTIINAPAAPDLSIAKTHIGNFTQGQLGAIYTITVNNTGTAATAGITTVIDTLPVGLTFVTGSGGGFTCSADLQVVTCTNPVAIAAAASAVITLTVNVAANAPAAVTNSATVTNPNIVGDPDDTVLDPTTIIPAGGVPTPLDGTYQLRYFANLDKGDSYVNLSNAGTLNGFAPVGNICVNVYTFDPAEELISCCACPITPNGLVSLSARQDLISNTLTPGVPTSITVKLLSSLPLPAGGTSVCNPSSPLATNLVRGARAWATTLHLNTSILPAPGVYQQTETPFSAVELSASELSKLTSFCGFIQANGSGFGICKSCRFGALGGGQK